jgi:hypothetical protein
MGTELVSNLPIETYMNATKKCNFKCIILINVSNHKIFKNWSACTFYTFLGKILGMSGRILVPYLPLLAWLFWLLAAQTKLG